MAVSNLPIFTKLPRIDLAGAIVGPSANTATDGTGANSTRIFTAGADGSYVEYVTFKAVASPAATVARIFYCSDTGTFTPGTTNTAANSTILEEVTMSSFTASNTLASPTYNVPINRRLPLSTKLFVTFGTSTGSAGNGYNPSVHGGDF